jgi:hypothetical protein
MMPSPAIACALQSSARKCENSSKTVTRCSTRSKPVIFIGGPWDASGRVFPQMRVQVVYDASIGVMNWPVTD